MGGKQSTKTPVHPFAMKTPTEKYEVGEESAASTLSSQPQRESERDAPTSDAPTKEEEKFQEAEQSVAGLIRQRNASQMLSKALREDVRELRSALRDYERTFSEKEGRQMTKAEKRQSAVRSAYQQYGQLQRERVRRRTDTGIFAEARTARNTVLDYQHGPRTVSPTELAFVKREKRRFVLLQARIAANRGTPAAAAAVAPAVAAAPATPGPDGPDP
eukprot:Hpha_TRINITY_DN11750_c0_g1::TRINITY_DN11750_c0_g1_i1::g.31941::m.31941